MEEIVSWMKKNAPYFEHEGNGTFATREGGDVGEETPGREDMEAAKHIVSMLNSTFGPNTAWWSTVDEWTEIYVNQ